MPAETKRCLVILTNESFLPKGGKGGRSYNPQQISEDSTQEDSEYSPSTWLPPISTTHGPGSTPDHDFYQAHRPTGVDIYEVGQLWFQLAREHNYDLTFATPRGGAVAIDPASIKALDKDFADKIWHECSLMAKLNHTIPCSWVLSKAADQFDCVIIPGSHAAMLDLPWSQSSRRVISKIWDASGLVCAIGHGVAALLEVKDKNQQYLVKGRRLTCFTTEEEEKSQAKAYLPFNLEEKLKQHGAQVKTAQAFQSNVQVDKQAGKTLITAQSHPSVHECICEIVKCCQ